MTPSAIRCLRRSAALFALLVLSAAGGCGSAGPDPAEPPSEPPPRLFVAPGGSDEGTGAAGDPFATFAAAHDAALPGEVVEIAAGAYGQQRWTHTSRSASEPVIFRPAPGAEVRLAYLDLQDVDDIEIRGVQTAGWYVGTGSDRVTLRDVRSRGNGNFITSAHDIRVIGGEIGPVDSDDGLQVKRAEGEADPSGIVLDGVDMRDISRRRDPDRHVDCVQFGAGRDVVIRNSRFRGCATQGVFLRPFGGGVIRDVLIENNWFGSVVEGFSGLIVDEDVGPDAGIVVRYNTSITGIRVEPAGAVLVANVAPFESFACRPEVVYRHNVWSEAACGPTDRTAPAGFAASSGDDLTPGPASAVVDAGDPDDFPATDIDGTERPLGAAPDAGANEVG